MDRNRFDVWTQRDKTLVSLSFVCSFILLPLLDRCAVAQGTGPLIRSQWSDQLVLSDIGSAIFPSPSRTAQMALTEGPTESQRYLYLSSIDFGIRRVVYDLQTRSLVSGSLEDVAPDIRSLGIAFDGDTLYASAFYVSDRDTDLKLSQLWRIEDRGFGNRTPIVQGIPRDDHGVNHLQIVGKSLYVGIGVRTRNGAFQTWSGDDFGESAYGGSIGVIDDLGQVGDAENAAGFYTAHPTALQYEQVINGQDPLASSPFTTTDPGKLRIHSSGTRNPFGVAVDGDSNVWFTNNSQRVENHVFDRDNLVNAEGDGFGGDGFQDDVHDQLFRAVPKADYGYRNGNWQDGNVAGNTAAVDAGFFSPENRARSFTFDNYVDPVADGDVDDQDPAYNQDYDVNAPVGLGPSSSSNGLAFYQGNELPLPFHQDAFIARWNGRITDGEPPNRDSLVYRDVVSVDRDTGDVQSIAYRFSNPLDVIEDGLGNLIVADYGGSIYLISPSESQVGPHEFSWDSDQDGNWSDRLKWNADSLPEADRLVPHQWGTARYAVQIDRPGSDLAVVLDRDAHVESVRIGQQFELDDGRTLTVDQQLEVLSGGQLAGGGVVAGQVVNRGDVRPGSDASPLNVAEYRQESEGRLVIDLDVGGVMRVDATNSAILAGELSVQVELVDLVRGEYRNADVVTASTISGDFERRRVNGQLIGSNGHIREGHFLRTDVTAIAARLSLYSAQAGDANGNGVFDSSDLIEVLQTGQYEDDVAANSTWIEGDWNGDSEFDSGDILAAFQSGTYVAEVRPVPEPASLLMCFWGLLLLQRLARAKR